MIYRDNTAYDFDLFVSKSEIVEIPNAPAHKHPSVRRTNAKTKTVSRGAQVAGSSLKKTIGAVAAVAIVLLLVIAQLNCQLQNSEVVDKITRTEKSIETLKSENTRLQVEVNGKISFTNMEKAAEGMGMQKTTVAQMQYINLCKEDVVEMPEGNGGLLAKIGELF